jgi:hypothetical protein
MTEDRPERRKHPRFEISFAMSFRFLRNDTRSGDSQSIEAIGTKTQGRVGNISLEGLFIEANPTEDQIREIMRANRDQEQLDIEIETRLMGETVNLMGRVVWYDIILPKHEPYHFRAGVFLGQLGGQTQKLWGNLISSLEQ